MTREEAKTNLIAMKAKFEVLLSMRGLEVSDVFDVAIESLSAEPSEASAREWCKQNGYVMMPEAVYEQDITKAYFEGQNIEPCEDAISRKSVIDVLIRNRVHFCDMVRITSELKELPPVTPQQKMGRWIREKKHHKDDFQEFDYWDVRCSECGARKRIGWTNIRHCPMCGAKMAESEDE